MCSHTHSGTALNRSGSDDTEAAPAPSRDQPISRSLHWSAVPLYPAARIDFSTPRTRTHTGKDETEERAITIWTMSSFGLFETDRSIEAF